MNTTRILGLSALALALAIPTAQAEDRAQAAATRLSEHPAVIVAHRGVQVDPASKFYLHPARLSWSLQRPLSEGEHPLELRNGERCGIGSGGGPGSGLPTTTHAVGYADVGGTASSCAHRPQGANRIDSRASSDDILKCNRE